MSEKWEVVGQKKQQKLKEKQDKQKKDKEALALYEEEEEEKRDNEKQKFFNQYVQAVNQVKASDPSNSFVDGSMYSAFMEIEEDKLAKLEAKEKKKKAKAKGAPFEPFEGEEIEFVDDAKKKQKQKQQQHTRTKSREEGNVANQNKKTTSVEEAASQLSGKTLNDLLATFSAKYPSNYDVQLKSLAEYLEIHFSQSKVETLEAEKNFSKKIDAPLGYVEQEAVHSIKRWMDKIPEEALVTFFWFLVTTVITLTNDQKKNVGTPISGVGLKLLVQLIARYYPNVVVKNIPSIKQSYISSGQSTQQITKVQWADRSALSLFVWIFAQPLQTHFSAALSLWFQFLLPLIFDLPQGDDARESSLYIIEKLVALRSKFQTSFMDELNVVSALERILLSKHTLDKQKAPELANILPKISDVSFLIPPTLVSKRLFSMLLGYAAHENAKLRDEVLSDMVFLLSQNSNNNSGASYYSYWKELYPKYVAQSNNLLLFIHLGWDKHKLSQKLDANALSEVADSFLQLNQQLRGELPPPSGTKKPRKLSVDELKEIDMCDVTCKAVKKKIRPFANSKSRGTGGASGTAGSSGLAFGTLFAVTVALGAGAFYTANNCCSMEWCRSLEIARNLLHC